MGGIGSGHGTKRPDHPTGKWLKGRSQLDPKQKKHLKSLFSAKPDPSCHGHKRARDRALGLPDHGVAAVKAAHMRNRDCKEEIIMTQDRRKTIAMEARDLQDLARHMANKAMQTLVDILDNPDSSDTARIQAIQMILDRGYGKPAATMTLQTVDIKAAQLDDKSLDERVTETLRRIENITEREVEEAESTERPPNIRVYN